jgi:hypothetical protein
MFQGAAKRFLWVLFTVQSWALWTTRKKFSIEAKFPKRPGNCIFKTIIFLQLWRPLERKEVLPMVDEAVVKFKEIFAALAN